MARKVESAPVEKIEYLEYLVQSYRTPGSYGWSFKTVYSYSDFKGVIIKKWLKGDTQDIGDKIWEW